MTKLRTVALVQMKTILWSNVLFLFLRHRCWAIVWICTVDKADCRKISQTSLTAVLQLCLDVKLRSGLLTGARVVPHQPAHCNVQHSQRRKHILGLSDTLASAAVLSKSAFAWPCIHLWQQDCFLLAPQCARNVLPCDEKITLVCFLFFFTFYYFH